MSLSSTIVPGTLIKFCPPTGIDTMMRGGITITTPTKHHCITVMKEYENLKSLEELRFEDYKLKTANLTTQMVGLFGSSPLTTSVSSCSTATFTSSNPTNTFAFSNPTPKFEFPSFEQISTNNVNKTSSAAFSCCTSAAASFPNSSNANFTFLKPSKFPNLNPTFTLGSSNTVQSKFGKTISDFKFPVCYASTQTEEELCVDKLLQGLNDMLLSSKYSDFILNVKENAFRVHKIILAAHSPVFSAMMEHDTKDTGVACIDDFEPITFSNLLIFMYTGKVNLNSDNVLDLYEAADKYQVTELCSLCIKYLMNNISVENFCEALTLSLRHHVGELNDAATKFFLKNSKEIALTAKWATFLKENPMAGNELFLKVLDLNSSTTF